MVVGSMHYGSGLEPLSYASCGPWRVSETDNVLLRMQCKQGYRTAVSAYHFVGIRVDNLNGHGVMDEYVKFGALANTHPPYKCATLKTYVFTRLYCVNSYVSVYTHVNVCKLSDQRMLRVANGSKRFVANKAHLQRCTQTTLESD